jgi:predicted enzyme related to lactoylglutathione lyase
MQTIQQRLATAVATIIMIAACAGVALPQTSAAPSVAVGSQYDSTHVYVAPSDFDRLVSSLVATFGGTATTKGAFTVTPTPSKTYSQLALTPAGSLSIFGFQTPIPYPFGSERTGYLVTDIDVAVASARAHGAAIVVAPFNDPIGKDAIIEWPGGVFMQLYWHTTAPHYPPLATIPENRIYISPDAADAFIRDFGGFAHATVISDVAHAPGAEIGLPGASYRRVRIRSPFGDMVLIVSDGFLPYPFGREITGYAVADLAAALTTAVANGATILVPAMTSDGRQSAIVDFPGGYIAELHSGIR